MAPHIDSRKASFAMGRVRSAPRTVFFGAGSYTTLEASYAVRYSNEPGLNGEHTCIFYLTAVGVAWIVTQALDYNERSQPGFSDFYSSHPDRSISLKPFYDTHFVPVREDPRHDFQACPEHEASAHEVVSDNWNQLYPLAIIYFQ